MITKAKLVHLLKKYFIKFGLIGILNTVMQQILYLFFMFFHLHYLPAQILSFILSLLFSFVLNSVYNYQVTMNLHLLRGFILANIPAFLIQFIMLNIIVQLFTIDEKYALILTLIVTVPLSFLLITKSMLKTKDTNR